MKALNSLLFILLVYSVQVQAQTDPCQVRRDKLIAKTGNGLIIVVNSGSPESYSESGMNANFYYLTGLTTNNAILVIDGKKGVSTVYRQARPWGPPEEAPAGLEVKKTEDFTKDLPRLLMGCNNVWMEMSQLKLLDQAGYGLNRLETIRSTSDSWDEAG